MNSFYTRLRAKYDEVFVDDGTLKEICALGSSSLGIGEGHWTWQELRCYKDRVPASIHAFYEKGEQGQLAGYYIAFALSEQGVIDLNAGEVISGKQFNFHHVLEKFSDAMGVYISMVCGRNSPAKALLLRALQLDFGILPGGNPDLPRPVYASPASIRGQVLIQNYGFHELPSNPGMWRCLRNPSL